MADEYKPITMAERQAYLEFLGANPRAAKIKDKDLLSPSYSGEFQEVNVDDLYSEFAPNLDYYGTNYGTDTAEGYIANLVIQGYAAPAIKKEVDRLEAEGKLDSTRTKKDYYSDVDTFVKENRAVDVKRKQLDPYYKAGIANPNQSYTPDDLPEFKAAVDARRKRYRTTNPKGAKEAEDEYVNQYITETQELLKYAGRTPYKDEMLRRKGTVLGYGK